MEVGQSANTLRLFLSDGRLRSDGKRDNAKPCQYECQAAERHFESVLTKLRRYPVLRQEGTSLHGDIPGGPDSSRHFAGLVSWSVFSRSRLDVGRRSQRHLETTASLLGEGTAASRRQFRPTNQRTITADGEESAAIPPVVRSRRRRCSRHRHAYPASPTTMV
jgi:hypothetical protein